MAGVNPILAGLACHCPQCGRGPLFAGYLKVHDRCAVCGQDLRAADSGDGPAVFIVLIVGAAVCFSALFAEVAFKPPIWLHMLIWPLLGAVLSLAALRPFKGVLVALQFHHRAAEARHGE
jgi:uncharacterized protein (DUF983 family)